MVGSTGGCERSPSGCTQEKLGIGRLMKKLVDIGALVCGHGDSNDLVFEDYGAEAAKRAFGDPAGVVSFVRVWDIALSLLQFHAVARRFHGRRQARRQVRSHGFGSSAALARSHACLAHLPAMLAAGSRPSPKRLGTGGGNLPSRKRVF